MVRFVPYLIFRGSTACHTCSVLLLPSNSSLCCLRGSCACHTRSVLLLPSNSLLCCLRGSHSRFMRFILFLSVHSLVWCFKGSHIRLLQPISFAFHRFQYTFRPCFTFRWKGITTSANRSLAMYTCAALWAYLSQLAGTARFDLKLTVDRTHRVHINSQMRKLTDVVPSSYILPCGFHCYAHALKTCVYACALLG